MVGMAAATVFVFDAIRVLVTLGSRSGPVRIEAFVVVFVVSLVTIPLVERASRSVVVGLSVGIAAARVLLQVLAPAPTLIGQAVAAAIVLGLFGAVVATTAIVFGGRLVGLSVLVGATVDLAILASLATLPLPWWRGVAPALGLLAAGVVTVGSAITEQRLTMPTRPPGRVPAVALGGVALWVALHVMLFSNIGWLNLLVGGETWIAVGAASLGIAGALVWETQGRAESHPAIAGLIAVIAAALLTNADGGWAAMLVAVIGAASGVALTGALERDSSAAPERVQWATGAVPALALLPVIGREIDGSGLNPEQMVLGSALALLGCGVLSTRHNPGRSGVALAATALGVAAAAAAVGGAIVGRVLVDEPATPGELLVATFNMDRGFRPDGEFDPHAAAQVVIDLSADVVALQDVQRGRIRDGATDLVVFLERRTDSTIEWVGRPDGTGAAIELGVAADEVGDRSIPGVAQIIEARIGGEGDAIRLLAVDAVGAPVGSEDVGGMLAAVWGGEARTVMAGSFDGTRDVEPMLTLFNAGLFDVTLVLPDIVPLTSPADLPTLQLDYILISQDLRPAGARVVEITSSDHRPVVSRVGIPED